MNKDKKRLWTKKRIGFLDQDKARLYEQRQEEDMDQVEDKTEAGFIDKHRTCNGPLDKARISWPRQIKNFGQGQDFYARTFTSTKFLYNKRMGFLDTDKDRISGQEQN